MLNIMQLSEFFFFFFFFLHLVKWLHGYFFESVADVGQMTLKVVYILYGDTFCKL